MEIGLVVLSARLTQALLSVWKSTTMACQTPEAAVGRGSDDAENQVAPVWDAVVDGKGWGCPVGGRVLERTATVIRRDDFISPSFEQQRSCATLRIGIHEASFSRRISVTSGRRRSSSTRSCTTASTCTVPRATSWSPARATRPARTW